MNGADWGGDVFDSPDDIARNVAWWAKDEHDYPLEEDREAFLHALYDGWVD